MQVRVLLTALPLVCCALATHGSSFITIQNAGFEGLTGADPIHFDGSGSLRDNHYSVQSGYPFEATGFASSTPIPGWQTSASAGTYNAPLSLVPGGVPEGQNVAWINVTGDIRQTLSDNFLGDTSYLLSVSIGSLQGYGFPGYQIGLFAGGTAVASLSSNSRVAPAGQFDTVSLSASVPSGSAFIGLPMEIRLGIPGSGIDQVNFDQVQLVATPVPESEWMAIGAGAALAAFAGFRRWR